MSNPMYNLDNSETDSSGNAHEAKTPEEYEKKLRNSAFQNAVEIQTATLLTVNAEKRSCTIRMNGMPHEDVTWALPIYNTDTGTGIDFIPSTEEGQGNQVLVAIDSNDNKFIIGVLPKVNRDNNSANEDYSEGRDDDLSANDVAVKVDNVDGTGFFAKARGLVEMIATPNLKFVLDKAEQLIKLKGDTFKLNTPQTNVSTDTNQAGEATLKLKHRSNESQNTGGEMLNIVVGRDLTEGQPEAQTTVSVNDVMQALNNEFNLDVDSNINITSNTGQINLTSVSGVNINTAVGPPENAVRGQSLKLKLQRLINLVKNHDHNYTTYQSQYTAPVPSMTKGVKADTVSDLTTLQGELETIISPNLTFNQSVTDF